MILPTDMESDLVGVQTFGMSEGTPKAFLSRVW